jgi:hypothetical protein
MSDIGYELREADTGEGVFATRRFGAGELVMRCIAAGPAGANDTYANQVGPGAWIHEEGGLEGPSHGRQGIRRVYPRCRAAEYRWLSRKSRAPRAGPTRIVAVRRTAAAAVWAAIVRSVPRRTTSSLQLARATTAAGHCSP